MLDETQSVDGTPSHPISENGRRLLLITGSDVRTYRGGEKFAINLANALSDYGVLTTILSKVYRVPDRRLSTDEVGKRSRVPVRYYRVLTLPGHNPIPLNPISPLNEIIDHEVAYSIDSSPLFVSYLVLLSKLTGRRLVIGIHHPSQVDCLANDLQGSFTRRFKGCLVLGVLRRVQTIHVINEHDRETLGALGLSRQVRLSSYMIPVGQMPTIQESPREFIALFVGALDSQQKGLDLLCDVIRRVVREESGIKFWIAGSGPNERLVSQLALDFPTRVKHLGFLSDDELATALNKASLLTVTSRSESFSYASLEAYSRGVPVIFFSIPGLEDVTSVFPEGGVPPFDTTAFSAKIVEFYRLWLSDNLRYLQLRNRCVERAYSRFSSEVTLPAMARVLGLN
jgi:glycosyltransferase involved in cell wall biosynthesis